MLIPLKWLVLYSFLSTCFIITNDCQKQFYQDVILFVELAKCFMNHRKVIGNPELHDKVRPQTVVESSLLLYWYEGRCRQNIKDQTDEVSEDTCVECRLGTGESVSERNGGAKQRKSELVTHRTWDTKKDNKTRVSKLNYRKILKHKIP